MGFWDLDRVPLPGDLEDEIASEADASSSALQYLEAQDDEFVARSLRLGISSGAVLDLGTGTGQIPIKLALKNPALLIHAVDTSEQMLRKAAIDAGRWGVERRIILNRARAENLPIDSGLFDLVVCNLCLHCLQEPVALIREMVRVCKTDGALLLRDLRRPGRLMFGRHVLKHGGQFRGRMRKQFEASVRAAYTQEELRSLIREAGVQNLSTFRMGSAYIGFERQRINSLSSGTVSS